MVLQNTDPSSDNPNESTNQDDVDKLLSRSEGRSEPTKPSRTRQILWLTVISMLIFFVPLYLFSASVTEDTKGISTDLGFIRTSLTQVPTPAPAIQKLLTPLAQAQGQLSQLNAVLPTIEASRPDWPALMTAIGNYDPSQLTLTTITRTASSLTIIGQSNDDLAITSFAHGLEQSNLFSRVTIQSIRAITVTPTVTLTKSSSSVVTNTATPKPFPSATKAAGLPQTNQQPTAVLATSQPTALSATAVPDPRDIYEPDATQPQAIALGQPQTHNFYPENDSDMVGFLAKVGHYYHVYTSNLAPGVDTIMSLRIGGVVVQNDDAAPGSLYSDIVLQDTGADTTAIVTISNRGMYGADKTYQVAVEEVSATPTPVQTTAPSPTPTRTSTPTATPTATSTATATPTATPDLRDSYEPDDINAHSISIGETQTHNFYPTGDVDKVSFPVKSGRFYQAFTSNLALGVDTVVNVLVDNQLWVNDDYAPGTGNFASSVCLTANQDGFATATITNKALQYGRDKAYTIKVSEILTLTAPSCVPITPVSAAALPQGKRVPGSAAPIRSGATSRDISPSVNSPTLEFVIIADLKVAAP